MDRPVKFDVKDEIASKDNTRYYLSINECPFSISTSSRKKERMIKPYNNFHRLFSTINVTFLLFVLCAYIRKVYKLVNKEIKTVGSKNRDLTFYSNC
jgi:hypothetical protein